MATDFVEGWSIIQTLGEGAYGEVKLLLNKQNGDLVAMKIIDMVRHPKVKELIKKEVIIHRMLKDPSIIAFLGYRTHSNHSYIFLEYAPHGELFDKIEPDIGMDTSDAQKYMFQLISGVEYLHSLGVAHRDLKPENLLLDATDNLKISDFGLATIFRAGGKERLLDKRCGTLPYVAPEVLCRPYAAEPADVWSCGIILVAMLAGELPWDRADPDNCKEYLMWKTNNYTSISPWTKISTLALCLLRRILAPAPSQRAAIHFIKQHRWMLPHINNTKSGSSLDSGAKKKLSRVDSEVCTSKERRELLEGLVQSQPATLLMSEGVQETAAPVPAVQQQLAFSQPVGTHDMFLPSQGFPLTQTQQTHLNPLQKLVKRMTRLFVTLSLEESMRELTSVLGKYSLEWKINSPYCVTIEMVDKRKTQLVFKANVIEMDSETTLIDFRLSKGCGLEFKKFFLSIKSSLSHWVVSPPSWAATLNIPE